MGNLFKIGRIFYGVAMAGIGFQILYYHGLLENGFEVMDADGYVLFFGRPNQDT